MTIERLLKKEDLQYEQCDGTFAYAGNNVNLLCLSDTMPHLAELLVWSECLVACGEPRLVSEVSARDDTPVWESAIDVRETSERWIMSVFTFEIRV